MDFRVWNIPSVWITVSKLRNSLGIYFVTADKKLLTLLIYNDEVSNSSNDHRLPISCKVEKI